jgi:hypothetical protein
MTTTDAFQRATIALDLAMQFGAIANMPDQQQSLIKHLLAGTVIKVRTECWSSKMK